MMSKGIEERAKFDKIRYANCWEDPELLIEVFANGGKFISIASAGDNSLSLLTKNPELVARFLNNNKYAMYQDGNNIDIYTNGLTLDGSDHDLSTIYRHIDGRMSYYTNETGSAVSDTIGAVLNYALQNSLKNKRSF